MSLTLIRPLFRSRLKALGYKEHVDGFNFDNIASTILDDSFHLSSGEITTAQANQITYDFDYPLTVRLFKRGFRKPGDALDTMDQVASTIYADVLQASVRLGDTIKDIEPNGYLVEPLAGSNDNGVILVMQFTCKLILCF